MPKVTTAKKLLKKKVTVYAGLGPDGRQRQLTGTAYGETATKLEQAAEAMRTDLRRRYQDDQAQWKGSFKELVDDWLKLKRTGTEMTTHYNVTNMSKRIVADLGRVSLVKLNARDLDRFYTRLIEGVPGRKKDEWIHRPVSPATVLHYHRVIHSMLHQAFLWDQVPGNVAKKASPPRKRQSSDHAHNVPTPAALLALIDSARPSLKMAAVLAAHTGCRRGEILALRWSSLDGTKFRVYESIAEVPGARQKDGTYAAPRRERKSPKSGATREIEVDADLLAALRAHRAHLTERAAAEGVELAADGPILANMAADPTGRTAHTPKWLTQAWRNHCRRQQAAAFRFHDIRHFHATELIAAGLDPVTIADRMGHSKASMTTDVYAKALQRNGELAATVISDVLRPGPLALAPPVSS